VQLNDSFISLTAVKIKLGVVFNVEYPSLGESRMTEEKEANEIPARATAITTTENSVIGSVFFIIPPLCPFKFRLSPDRKSFNL
jgi:hypothetical protein